MYADISQPPKPSPKPNLSNPHPGVSLLRPLSRLGRGPGILLLVPDSEPLLSTNGVPSVTLKWAQEGYVIAQLQAVALASPSALRDAVAAIKQCAEHDGTNHLGLVAYELGLWTQAAAHLPSVPEISCAVIYAESSGLAPSDSPVPVLYHLAGAASALRTSGKTIYAYPSAKSSSFALPHAPDFSYGLEAVSHTRNLTFLKPLVGGPYFDLEAVWEEHMHYEFVDRSVEHTMSTMVDEPYVNHVPTLTGGIGGPSLTDFYRNHFIFANDPNVEIELVSRTVGIDRVIDEFVFRFTHDREVQWALPGVPPTGRRVEMACTSVVNIRGDRLYHEHIAWDQASVLKQLGLLPDHLPWPYDHPDGLPEERRFEYRLPVAGVESARKLVDRLAAPSNGMLSYTLREAGV